MTDWNGQYVGGFFWENERRALKSKPCKAYVQQLMCRLEGSTVDRLWTELDPTACDLAYW
ncbi:MAG: hypothetical protein Tsb009_09420 [Planctomycetaceae bacterium]